MQYLIASLRSFLNGLRRPSQLDADMNDEMRFHIDLEAQRLMQQHGLDSIEAHRRAAIAFGGVEKYRGAGRDVLGLTWVRGMSTDFKLGTRMLRKYPGLTAVALFALSLAIGAGAAYLEFINDLMHGKLPFADADRIVGIQIWDRQSGATDKRGTADFVAWRGSLRSFEDLAAYRPLERNLITDDGHAEPVRGVEISASAFRIARVPPLLGRPLVPDDERSGAPPVAVIGYNLWTTRFASERGIVGRSIRFGGTRHTIVGVMPEGFGLPVRQSLWLPLQLNTASYPRHDGPETRLFGKLADGVEIAAAQAELDARAIQTAAQFPSTDAHMHPVVKPYVDSLWSAADDSSIQTIVLYGANVFFIGLLSLCGANIATLVFARTATREAEITVRTALGASRARIAGQLFAEALVLSSIATVLGLVVAYYGLHWVKSAVTTGMGEPIMFWWNDSLSLTTLFYAAVLAVVSAIIIGVTPALKATGIRVQDRLKHASGGSAAGMRFGGIWTGVIVTQVAVTVVFIASVGMLGRSSYAANGAARASNFPSTEYVSVRLTHERAATPAGANRDEVDAADRSRFRATYLEFARRLSADPAVAGVTYSTRLPRMEQLPMRIEIDGGSDLPAGDSAPYVGVAPVGVNFMETFQAPIVAGRDFSPADLAPGHAVAIVDETFVRQALKGQAAIGRRVREAGGDGRPPGPWLEIVGVVNNLTGDARKPMRYSMIYQPAAPETLSVVRMAVRARTDVTAVMSRLRSIAAETDPALRLENLQTMDKLSEVDLAAVDFFGRLLAGISIVALILATAGVYALMSFTVSRRTSEIGIRVALGANPTRIVMATFARALAQVTAGLIAGAIPAAILVASFGPEVSPTADTDSAILTCAIATVAVALITALASVGPARRALGIQPTDALRAT